MATPTTRRVIVDVDVGTDDFLALLLLLRADQLKEIKIEAISCSLGNTSVDNVCANVVRLLELVNRTDIPVFRGATKSILPPRHKYRRYCGEDGLGDLTYNSEPDLSIVDLTRSSAEAIRQLVVTYPGEISLICIAPLTNIALAIRLYDDFLPNVKDLWIMGGNYVAQGNLTATCEYNFSIDPEAAFIVLDSVVQPVYMVTWETCIKSTITYEWRFNVFGVNNNPAIQLLNRAERSIKNTLDEIWLPCDALLVAAFLHSDPLIVTKTPHFATVELSGLVTRGQVVLDYSKRDKKRVNVTVIEDVDNEEFKNLLMTL